MLIRSSIPLFALTTWVAAKKHSATPSANIAASSKLGNKLLSKARRLEQGDDERDFTWISGYSIRFKSCHTITTIPNEENDGQGDARLYNNNVVVFQLCPSDTCDGKCNDGAEYAVDMAQFVGAYTESKMEAQEYECEMIQENCYCNDDDEEACENQCFVDAGADYCVENENEDEEDFEIERALECEAMENNQNLYIGPYCASNGKEIYLGIFSDAGCVNTAEDGLYLYERYNYRTLPYTSESLVDSDCISCKQAGDNDNDNNNNNGDDNQEEEILEMCEELYEQSAKCESSLGSPSYSSYWYPDDNACEYIQKTLPSLDRVFRANGTPGRAAKAWATVFAFSTVSLAGLSYWLHTKVKRSSINLSDQGGDQDQA